MWFRYSTFSYGGQLEENQSKEFIHLRHDGFTGSWDASN